MLYLSHHQLPTSTRQALKCRFVKPDADSLVLGKHSTIEVYGIETHGLELLHTSKLFDVIEHINSYKKLTDPTSTLLVLTADLNLFTLQFCSRTSTIITTASISLHQIGARPADYIQTSIVDPHGRCVVVHALNGILHIIPLAPGFLSKLKIPDAAPSKRKSKTGISVGFLSQTKNLPHNEHNKPGGELYRCFPLRLTEVNVHALNFASLSPDHPPTLLIVYSNHLGDRVLRSRKIDLEAGNCEEELLRSYNCRDPMTGLIIPVSIPSRASDADHTAGAILVGEESAELIRFAPPLASSSPSSSKGPMKPSGSTIGQRRQPADQSVVFGTATKIPLGAYTCFCQIDGVPLSWLLGDLYGNLILLVLKRSTTSMKPSLSYHHVGHVPSPEALVYIPHQYVFLASHYGDSQLLKLPSLVLSLARSTALLSDLEKAQHEPPQVITTFSNLAPISDFCVTQDRRNLTNQIVTCSGAYRDCSLRLIRHGTGICQSGTLEVGGVQRLWALRSSTQVQSFEDFDDRLVLSSADCTRFLALNEDGTIEEIDQFNGFESKVPTILAGNLVDAYHSSSRCSIQVTYKKVIAGQALVWEPDHNDSMTSAAFGISTCAVALKRQVVVLCLKKGSFIEEGSCVLPNDISTLAVDPHEKFVAAAQWATNCIEIISISTSSCVSRVNTGSEFMINSLMMTNFGQTEYDGCRLLIGLGDGKMMNLDLGSNGIIVGQNTPTTTTLGLRPVEFVAMKNTGRAIVWAHSDQPTLIDRTQNNGRFTYTPVSAQGGWVTSATGLHSQFFQDSIVLAFDEEIRIGKLNPNGKMNSVKISLGTEQPRRIAHSKKMKAYGVICVRLELDQKSGVLNRIGSFKIFDDETFQLLKSFKLRDMEQGSSIAAIKLGADMMEHFLVGTGVIKPSETEAKSGRILAVREMTRTREDGTTTKRNFGLTHVVRLSGSVGGLGALPNGMFVASANAFVHAFGMKPCCAWMKEHTDAVRPLDNSPDAIAGGYEEPEIDGGIKLLDTWGGGFVSQTVVTDGTKVLVGDLYKSVVLLEFDLERLELTVKARDFSAMSVRPIGTISKREFIAADSELNLFTVSYQNNPPSPRPDGETNAACDDSGLESRDENDDLGNDDEDSDDEDEDDYQDDGQANTHSDGAGAYTGDDEILSQVGAFHLGENVNHFRTGSIIPSCVESSLIGQTKLLFATSTGGIGLIAKIHSRKKINQLARFQDVLSKISTSVGNLEHPAYRMFKTKSRKVESTGFLDGDFLEECLDLPHEEIEKLIKKMDALKPGSQEGDGGETSKPTGPVPYKLNPPLPPPSPFALSSSLHRDQQDLGGGPTIEFSEVFDSLAQLERLH
ncbi:hypothetical protein PCANC_16226 [Puccinia coronata f. sp. avenae]|uniref:Cleavage/polyadenylation specificity factor A subunit C-terminal domain-containing protein n=1 Tax=Puccinia coronata f. sp. avenae TaxID=200324 RepID=A0A2N5U1H6_9BASI|nr:hypothetical protein PCANC_16226 [Puccinia coronata f. sp. avenae]